MFLCEVALGQIRDIVPPKTFRPCGRLGGGGEKVRKEVSD